MCLTFWGGEAVSRMRIRLNALVTLSHGKGFTLFPFYRVSFRVLYCAYIIIKLAATSFQLVALCTSLNLEWSRNKQVLLVDIKYWLRLHLFKLGSSIAFASTWFTPIREPKNTVIKPSEKTERNWSQHKTDSGVEEVKSSPHNVSKSGRTTKRASKSKTNERRYKLRLATLTNLGVLKLI